MKPIARIITGLLLLGICLGIAAFWNVSGISLASSKVVSGVTAGGVELGGMDRESGVNALRPLELEVESHPLIFTYQDSSWEISPENIGLDLDVDKIMDNALGAGKDNNPIVSWQRQREIRNSGHDIDLVYILNKDLLYQELDNIARAVATPPVDATFKLGPGDSIEIIPGKDGVTVNKEQAYEDLLNSLARTKERVTVNVSLMNAEPNRTTGDISAMGLKGLLGSYATSFDPTSVSRTYNIRVAAAALDGLLVAPGQEVSFNKVVGPRSSEAGYKNAKVIVNNEFVDGLGGGVCQISSTLYNAVLVSNLEILDRSNHSLPVAYVPLGRDATVVYGAIDFRFRNNTESYIYIRTFVDKTRVTIKIFGNTDYKAPVDIKTWVTQVFEPEVSKEPDPNLEKGQEVVKQSGSKGYRVAAERIVMENGVPQREILPSSTYKPVKKVIAVGTKEMENMPIVIPPGHEPEAPGEPDNAGDPVDTDMTTEVQDNGNYDETAPMDSGLSTVEEDTYQ